MKYPYLDRQIDINLISNYLFTILPEGLLSKNEMGALRIQSKALLCNSCKSLQKNYQFIEWNEIWSIINHLRNKREPFRSLLTLAWRMHFLTRYFSRNQAKAQEIIHPTRQPINQNVLSSSLSVLAHKPNLQEQNRNIECGSCTHTCVYSSKRLQPTILPVICEYFGYLRQPKQEDNTEK